MEKIRIGNDIELRWKVYTAQDENTLIPYDLTGRELKASLRCDFGETPVDFRTEENELIAIFRGKDQKALGQYYIILRENDGKDAMKTVDTQEAFELVPRTMDESHSEDGVVRCFHLTFESVVGSWSGTIDPILNHDAELAEAQRKANEEGRVVAEQARQEASAEAVASANDATENANIKAEEANNAAISANTAAKTANAAASNADNAAVTAQQKAEAASSAAEAATSAAESANNAAENAQQKAQAAQDAAVSANGAASDANSAAENARQKAEEANEATISANNATEAANVAAGNAQQQAQSANEAASSANNAATAANAAAENAQQKANEANTAATLASGAAEAADTAAGRANEAADKFNAAIVQETGDSQDKAMSQKAVTDALTASQEKLSELESKTDDISKEIIGTEDESITIEDNNGNVLAKITSDNSSFKNLKNNGKDVLTEHQDISNLATKEDLEGIEHESIVEEEEEVVFEDENGNFCARVNHRGVDSVGYALNENPITKTHEPSNKCKGLTHYYHEGGDTIQYTYDFTEDSYIIHNPNGVNGNIYAEIVGLKAGNTYRISGIGSGITSTKRICASNVVSGLNNTIAELEDNGEGIYSAKFTVLENTITTINIAPRYNSKLTSFTNIKVIEVSDVERSVLVNNFVDNISLEELSDNLKNHLSIDENPTTYCGRSACVFNNVLFIGDSLTEGAFNKKGTNGMSDASGSFYRQEYSYPSFFKKLTGANGENWGLGGHTTKEWWDVRTTEGNPSYKPDDQWKGFDCAIIALGTNDAFRSSSASVTTTALNNIINKVLTLNPRISIFVATPFGGRFALDSKFTEVSETIRDVVNGRTDCYLLDINRYGHMNEKRGYNAGHFTAIGYERLAEDIINYMSWIIDSNDWDFRHVQFSNTDYEPFN